MCAERYGGLGPPVKRGLPPSGSKATGSRKQKKSSGVGNFGGFVAGVAGGSPRDDFVYDFPGRAPQLPPHPQLPHPPPSPSSPLPLPSLAHAHPRRHPTPRLMPRGLRRGRVRKGTSSRSGAGLVGASAAAVAKAAAREAEQRKREERQAQLAAERAAEKERRRVEEEAERQFWACPEELEMTPERKAMLKILQELFNLRHAAFNQVFTCATGGVDGGAASGEAAVSPNVHDVFLRFKQGEISGMAAFASEVRSVFHKCYHTFGMPEAAFISKCCEKLDLVFEQQINLLPRSLREQAVMPQPPQGGEAEGEEGGEERRRSSRARVSVQMLTTLQLVELEKRRRRGEEDKEKQRERERVRLVAEAWAAETVTPAALARVRASFDAVTVCYFCARHAERIGLPAFSLAEFEAGLGCFAAQCTLLRAALVQLLRLSETDRKAVAAQPAEPTAAWVAKALAKRIGVWALNVQNAKRIEESGDYPDEWLEPYCEDGELQELLVGLGDLDELQAALAASGLAALSLEQLSRLLRALCEQLLKLDRSVALVDAEDPSKARFLGRDSGGEAYFHFGAPFGRLYALSDKRLPTSHKESCARAPDGHLVHEGEVVEVEVEEARDGETTVEWRQAQVRRIIPGASGRFTACVLLEDGNPDEEFVECYDASQKDAEWRKVRSKAEIAREKREAAAVAKREAAAATAAAAAAREVRAAQAHLPSTPRVGPGAITGQLRPARRLRTDGV